MSGEALAAGCRCLNPGRCRWRKPPDSLLAKLRPAATKWDHVSEDIEEEFPSINTLASVQPRIH